MEREIIHIDTIKRLATEAGFDICGVTRAEYRPELEERFRSWLEAGYGDGLDYLLNYHDLRFDPSKLVPGARSVIVCGVNYKSSYALSTPAENDSNVASYALMRDYHKTIKRHLKSLYRELQQIYPSLEGRMFTDSAPIFEKHHAVLAGLGWIGRQSLLVTPNYGTYVVLGELVVNAAVDSYDVPLSEDVGCGECRRCIESCPAQAINEDRTIDSRRCIAARTIEHAEIGSAPLAGWIFGCDMCQRCCPKGLHTPLANAQDFMPIITPPSAYEWLKMSEDDFERFAQGTPIKRSSIGRIKEAIRLNRSEM